MKKFEYKIIQKINAGEILSVANSEEEQNKGWRLLSISTKFSYNHGPGFGNNDSSTTLYIGTFERPYDENVEKADYEASRTECGECQGTLNLTVICAIRGRSFDQIKDREHCPRFKNKNNDKN